MQCQLSPFTAVMHYLVQHKGEDRAHPSFSFEDLGGRRKKSYPVCTTFGLLLLLVLYKMPPTSSSTSTLSSQWGPSHLLEKGQESFSLLSFLN